LAKTPAAAPRAAERRVAKAPARPRADPGGVETVIDLLPARRRIAAAARRAAAVQFPDSTPPVAAKANPARTEADPGGEDFSPTGRVAALISEAALPIPEDGKDTGTADPAPEQPDLDDFPLVFVDSYQFHPAGAVALAPPAGKSVAAADPAGVPAGGEAGGGAGAARLETALALFDVTRVRADFPALDQQVHGRPLVYLDNANTTQKPRAVIDAVSRFYGRDYANIHRGLYQLSERATAAYEGVRERVRRFVNAAEASEIVFTRGTTEAINLVAHSFARRRIGPGDEILITAMEHHSNIVPWQMITGETGAILRVVPIFDDGELDLDAYDRMLGPRTRLVAFTHASNALGTINPVREMIARARARGVPTLVDGAQAAPHLTIDVRDLDCDFYALSGHKIFGPTGIGVLYGRAAHLEAMPPYQGGGDMIASVTFEKTIYNRPPMRFEAGTPDIAGVIGLGAAIDYLEGLDHDGRAAHEDDLLAYATAGLEGIAGLRIIGRARRKTAVLSFVLDDIHPHDIGTILDREGIAVRAGHHCAQPLMDRFGVPATARASFAFYNTRDEVDALVAAVRKVLRVFRR
jgi:cysteine desulfurase/selenocysteine lyase